ncbi:hypothetical protein [Streptomyces sp. NPDC041003]|uniref:hypothetical protein n=1 Tax=Streptomyces sp. NPDC041003 TaxID=3155730 RepID=UPI003410DFE4
MDATSDAAVGPAPAALAPDLAPDLAPALAPDVALADGGPAGTPMVPAQAGPATAGRAARARVTAAAVTGAPARPAASAGVGMGPASSAPAAAADGPAVPAHPEPDGSGHPAGPAQRYPRPVVTELRLSAYGPHRSAAFPLGPVTLFAGPSGSGKSQALAAYESLAGLGSGATLEEAFPDPRARIPDLAVPDAQRRRGFRLGCTVDGPAGPVRLDLAVQAEPTLRIVGERLTQDGQILLATALRDPGRRSVQAAWLTGGAIGVTRAPLPDDRLGTALLPLRVAGSTAGQRQVLAAAEQVVVALRSVFPCDPRPHRMRAAVPPAPCAWSEATRSSEAAGCPGGAQRSTSTVGTGSSAVQAPSPGPGDPASQFGVSSSPCAPVDSSRSACVRSSPARYRVSPTVSRAPRASTASRAPRTTSA